ncbi:MAG: Obg family GTPase CgtA, partial [Desulfovibrionaceae bacterium]|nr:Obg family GTPase CgtA [Desulfovibrionaceae bacterium]
ERYSVPTLLFINKMDLPGADQNQKRIQALAEGIGCPVFPVSAALHKGFDELLDEAARQLEDLPPVLHYLEEEVPEEKTDLNAFEISCEDGIFIVSGSGMDRLIDSVNFDDQESLNWFHRSLRRLGVIDALREAGAREGSVVRIAEMEFDFVE